MSAVRNCQLGLQVILGSIGLTGQLVLQGHDLRVGVVDDLVHLCVQVGILLRKRLRSVFLVESAPVSLG